MMYDEDDDGPPPVRGWEDCGGWYARGWRETPPADAQFGESPARYFARVEPAPMPTAFPASAWPEGTHPKARFASTMNRASHLRETTDG